MNATREHAVAALVTCAAVGTLAAVAMLTVVPALATPPSGATATVLARAQFGDITFKAKSSDGKAWIKTNGFSDVTVVQFTVQPAGNFGWHSDPGPEFQIVTSGTATDYQGDDPTCTPEVVPAGSGHFEPAGRVHIVRNEGSVPLVIVGTLLVPTGATLRIDEPNRGNCRF